jgi:8-oxo-dGTP pyrophosphatase MutT (NUDIX family)
MNKRLVPEDAILIPEHAANVLKGEIFDTYQWDEKDFEGGTMRFEMVRRPDTVAVICIVDDKLVVLDEVQPHRGARRNFPGGRVDETDESIIAAAQREVHEETGYRFENWRLVKVYQPIAKMEWFIHRARYTINCNTGGDCAGTDGYTYTHYFQSPFAAFIRWGAATELSTSNSLLRRWLPRSTKA